MFAYPTIHCLDSPSQQFLQNPALVCTERSDSEFEGQDNGVAGVRE
jgi:hypothetical protein